MLSKQSSCFVDAIEIAYGVSGVEIDQAYREILGVCKVEHDPFVDGYHPSVVNQVLVERFNFGLINLDYLPVNENGNCYSDGPAHSLVQMLLRPGFRGVVTGRKANGEPHAVAVRDGIFTDPADGKHSKYPSIRVLMLWFVLEGDLNDAS